MSTKRVANANRVRKILDLFPWHDQLLELLRRLKKNHDNFEQTYLTQVGKEHYFQLIDTMLSEYVVFINHRQIVHIIVTEKPNVYRGEFTLYYMD